MLEASDVAEQYSLYEKHDFQAVDTHTYSDKERFTNDEDLTIVTITRNIDT